MYISVVRRCGYMYSHRHVCIYKGGWGIKIDTRGYVCIYYIVYEFPPVMLGLVGRKWLRV